MSTETEQDQGDDYMEIVLTDDEGDDDEEFIRSGITGTPISVEPIRSDGSAEPLDPEELIIALALVIRRTKTPRFVFRVKQFKGIIIEIELNQESDKPIGENGVYFGIQLSFVDNNFNQVEDINGGVAMAPVFLPYADTILSTATPPESPKLVSREITANARPGDIIVLAQRAKMKRDGSFAPLNNETQHCRVASLKIIH